MPVEVNGVERSWLVVVFHEFIEDLNHERHGFFSGNIKAWVMQMNNTQSLHRRWLHGKGLKYNQNILILDHHFSHTNVTRTGGLVACRLEAR